MTAQRPNVDAHGNDRDDMTTKPMGFERRWLECADVSCEGCKAARDYIAEQQRQLFSVEEAQAIRATEIRRLRALVERHHDSGTCPLSPSCWQV